MNKKQLFTVKEIAAIGLMAAMLEAVKFALASIPNVELVTLLIIMFTILLGWKTIIAVIAFVLMECTVYGFGLWTVMYFYIWPLLVILTILLKPMKSRFTYTMLSSVFGFVFGALCAIPYFFIGGVATAFTWWVAGIPFDIIHGVSNCILCFILFKPLDRAIGYAKKYI